MSIFDGVYFLFCCHTVNLPVLKYSKIFIMNFKVKFHKKCTCPISQLCKLDDVHLTFVCTNNCLSLGILTTTLPSLNLSYLIL